MHDKYNTTQNDEINLLELWAIIVKHKLVIFAISLITTMSGTIYIWTTQPIYSGEVLIEIGSVIFNSDTSNDKPTIVQSLENSGDLNEVINQAFNTDVPKKEKIIINSPRGSNSLIKITFEGTDKQQIMKKLDNVAIFVLKRHQSKAKFYQGANAKIRPSSLTGNITITHDPINLKKQSIILIGLGSGLVLGIFLAFFLELIQKMRTPRE